MRDRDAKFYFGLMWMFFFFAVLVRLWLWFVGVKLEIPYFDNFLIFAGDVAGTIAKTIGGTLGSWTE